MPVFTSTKGFTDKMERFCQEYLIDLNATQAATRAGYSRRTANEQGSQLLAKLSIKQRIEELAKLNAIAAEVTPALVLSTINEAMQRCKGDEQSGSKFDARGVFRGAELLGRYLSLFTDKTEHTGVVSQKIQIIPPDASPEKAAQVYREIFRN
jgi:phage terminase small subunit